MKKIIIDGEVLTVDRMDGIHRFMIETISRLDQLVTDSDLEIYIIHRSTGALKNITLNNIKDVPLDCAGKRYRLQVVPKYIKSVDGIYCSMSNDAVMCKNSIFTIMDLIPLYKIANYPAKALIRMKLTYFLMKKFGGRIVTISNESKKDIVSKLGISDDMISLVGTGHEHMQKIETDESVFDKFQKAEKGKYYYAIGNQYPYKNFVWVREVAKRNPGETFIVAGSKTNITGGELSDSDNMCYVGYVSDSENKTLMMNAKAFIHPSKLEGFGMPPLEALSLGTPVIVSNASCLPEIYGNTAHYIDPDNYDTDINDLLKQEVESPQKILEKFSWDNVAKDWMKIFRECADS